MYTVNKLVIATWEAGRQMSEIGEEDQEVQSSS